MLNINIIKDTEKFLELKDLFTDEEKVSKLIKLYQMSETEHKRNNKLTADVGTSREKDIISFMKYYYSDFLNYDIDNEKEEDLIFKNTKISIKHSSMKRVTNQNIKILWTVNKDLQQKFIETFEFNCDLLIVYVRFDTNQKGEIEVLYILKDILNQKKEEYKECIFSTYDKSNGRGIGFQTNYFKTIVNSCEFRYKIEFDNLNSSTEDSIERRLNIIKNLHP